MKRKEKLEKIREWIEKNGACQIDIDNQEILLYNGGLFQDMSSRKANLWIGDLNSSINYLQSLKRLLDKLGFNTNRS